MFSKSIRRAALQLCLKPTNGEGVLNSISQQILSYQPSSHPPFFVIIKEKENHKTLILLLFLLINQATKCILAFICELGKHLLAVF